MALSPEKILARLNVVDRTAESIETTSMWVIHRRNSAKQIADCWLDTFRRADTERQIALFYLANDVCQKTKKKNDAHIVLQSFAPCWIKAIEFSRTDEAVRNAINRILDIFEERQVYSKSQLTDMRNALCETGDLDKSVLNFDATLLVSKIENYRKKEFLMERARILLSKTDFNFKEKMKNHMKNREDGEKFKNDIELSIKKLKDFVSTLKAHEDRGALLLEHVDSAKRFLILQTRDVTVVEDAYQKFGAGIESMKADVEEMIKTGVFPGASPPRDAPSPTANDDPFSAGVEEAFEQMRRPRENTEVTDMDVEKDDELTTGSISLKTSQTFASPSDALPREMGQPVVENDKMQKASLVSRGSDPRLSEQSRFFTQIPVVTLSTSVNIPVKYNTAIPVGSVQGPSLTVQTPSLEQLANFPYPATRVSSQLSENLNNQSSFYQTRQNPQRLSQQPHHSSFSATTSPVTPLTPTDGVANLRLQSTSPRDYPPPWLPGSQPNFPYHEAATSRSISPSRMQMTQQVRGGRVTEFSSRPVYAFPGQVQSSSFNSSYTTNESDIRSASLNSQNLMMMNQRVSVNPPVSRAEFQVPPFTESLPSKIDASYPLHPSFSHSTYSEEVSHFASDRVDYPENGEYPVIKRSRTRSGNTVNRESSSYHYRNDDGRFYNPRSHPYDQNRRYSFDRPDFDRRNDSDDFRSEHRWFYKHHGRDRRY